jgi:uncharacterized protein YlaN (UPF0358 family)
MREVTNLQESVMELLEKDSKRILTLLNKQIKYPAKPQYPFYEDLLDTQIFGYSQVIDFLVRLGLLDQAEGKRIINNLEVKLNKMYS